MARTHLVPLMRQGELAVGDTGFSDRRYFIFRERQGGFVAGASSADHTLAVSQVLARQEHVNIPFKKFKILSTCFRQRDNLIEKHRMVFHGIAQLVQLKLIFGQATLEPVFDIPTWN